MSASDTLDVDSWAMALQNLQTQSIEDARPLFEQFLQQHPTASRYWKAYIEKEMEAKAYDRVDKLFVRSLLTCLNIDLWRCYLEYIKTIKIGEVNREEVIKAHEFVLEHMGQDISASQVWVSYIKCLKSLPTATPADDSHKMTLLRKAYQRAIAIPMHNVENLWKEYEAFENNLSKQLAKPLLQEHVGRHTAARSMYRELRRRREGLIINMVPRPPRGNKKEETQMELWTSLIEFERSNPMKLEEKQLIARVVFSYNQALLCLRHYPSIWYDLAMYLSGHQYVDEATAVFGRSLEALPSNLLLHFAFADFHEARKQIQAAKSIYERLISREDVEPLVFIIYQRFARRTEGLKGARDVFSIARKSARCSYHVYVASAHLEHFINKDAAVARKIFELGLSKFANEPSFVLQYIEFLHQLNDEKNVRVLFERVLSHLEPVHAREVWNRFVHFEHQCGDLDAVQRVESRRTAVYPELNTQAPGGFRNLLPRYRFLDLWPCTASDVDGAGHEEELQTVSQPLSQNIIRSKVELLNPSQLTRESYAFPRPDFSKMSPYTSELASAPLPVQQADMGFHIQAQLLGLDTTRQLPPANTPEPLAQFLALLPSREQFRGSFPDHVYLINSLLRMDLPPSLYEIAAGTSSELLVQSNGGSTATTSTGAGQSRDPRRRKRRDRNEDSDEEQNGSGAVGGPGVPMRDIYRERQQHKISKPNPT
eukprot:GILJ01009800.1.p1 GENE.GILJ01009800.1~~GILJ01009800.1.p1  ORF type:complete len:710 (-),score=102.51 GILJ01009800.1:90-2219(-)